MDGDDGWVSMAMSNELLVANLLLQLRHDTLPSPPPQPPRRSTKRASPVLNHRWSVYRARSTKRRPKDTTKRRSETPKRPAATAGKKGKPEPEPEPVSPDTPLSWNGSTSKVGDQSKTAPAKRSRRKRTLAELKEEESLLLEKRKDLKNKLASLHHNVEKHRATNQSLKRIKLNLASQHILTICTTSMVSGEAVLEPPQLAEARCHLSESVFPQRVKDDKVLDGAPNASSKQEEISNQEPLLLLPDLNMPAGEDFNSQV